MVYGEMDIRKINPWVYQAPNQATGQRGKLRSAERAIDRKAQYESKRHRKARMIAEHRDRKRRAGHWDGGWVVPFVCVCVACMLVFKSL